jgi:hypothetical protein
VAVFWGLLRIVGNVSINVAWNAVPEDLLVVMRLDAEYGNPVDVPPPVGIHYMFVVCYPRIRRLRCRGSGCQQRPRSWPLDAS